MSKLDKVIQCYGCRKDATYRVWRPERVDIDGSGNPLCDRCAHATITVNLENAKEPPRTDGAQVWPGPLEPLYGRLAALEGRVLELEMARLAEDEEDARESAAALAEPGASIPWAEVKAVLSEPEPWSGVHPGGTTRPRRPPVEFAALERRLADAVETMRRFAHLLEGAIAAATAPEKST